jgi:hypothetical protein
MTMFARIAAAQAAISGRDFGLASQAAAGLGI